MVSLDRLPAASARHRSEEAALLEDRVAVNSVEPLIDGGEIFPAARRLIQGARQSVRVEMYDFQSDDLRAIAFPTRDGSAEQRQLVNDLVADAERGVHVQVLLDGSRTPSGRRNNEDVAAWLASKGVETRFYPADTVNIDHVKLLVVDDQQVLIGGMNWSNRSPIHHDADVLISGPAARDASALFEADWNFAGQSVPGESVQGVDPVLSPPGRVRFFTTSPDEQSGGASDIRNHLLEEVHAARSSIHVEMYVMNNPAVIEALGKARSRGVDVRVVLDPSQPRVNEKAAQALLERGVEVRWFHPTQGNQLLHAKWAVFDGRYVDLGSANWTTQGLDGAGCRSNDSRPSRGRRNHEANVHVQDEATARRFEEQFEEDWALHSDTRPRAPAGRSFEIA